MKKRVASAGYGCQEMRWYFQIRPRRRGCVEHARLSTAPLVMKSDCPLADFGLRRASNCCFRMQHMKAVTFSDSSVRSQRVMRRRCCQEILCREGSRGHSQRAAQKFLCPMGSIGIFSDRLKRRAVCKCDLATLISPKKIEVRLN